jgi:hypothetical protein
MKAKVIPGAGSYITQLGGYRTFISNPLSHDFPFSMDPDLQVYSLPQIALLAGWMQQLHCFLIQIFSF